MSRPAVLVTGAARRLGRTIAQAFAEQGWHVIIHYGSSRHEAEALAATLSSAKIVTADLANVDQAIEMVENLAQTVSDWRVLVNCASVFELDDATLFSADVFDRAMRINAQAPAAMAQAFLGQAKSALGRRVINVSDQKIANINPDFFSYTMSKTALAAATTMLSMARTDPRDRVYGLAPGAILASHDQREEETERSHLMNLLRRKTGADEIAAAALFLAEGWLESGETVFIDSGQHLLSQPRDVLFLARD
ncbi:oxidoreductase [Novosphingobium barchaimii]|nr:oxidoreductase [Novosphingobium barchaimii]